MEQYGKVRISFILTIHASFCHSEEMRDCPIELLLLQNLRSRFLLRGRVVTPLVYYSSYNVVQCLTMYYKSLNEILD
jgi:hypothetical protein